MTALDLGHEGGWQRRFVLGASDRDGAVVGLLGLVATYGGAATYAVGRDAEPVDAVDGLGGENRVATGRVVVAGKVTLRVRI